MKKIMILGASAGQIPFIKLCKNKGAYVIVVSPMGNYPGIKLADKFFDCDTRDYESILKFAEAEEIDAITTDQTDVSVPSVAYVAEKMNLKGIGYDTALKFTDKYIMRKCAKEKGINVPGFFCASKLEDAIALSSSLEWPLIIKPTNSSGSRGVYRVDSLEDMTEKFEKSISYSSTNTVIIEEYIEGIEYLADGLAMEHKYINLDVGIKEYFDKEGCYISKMCMFSSAALDEGEVERLVLETNKRIVEAFGLKFGITHAEYMYSPKRKKVYLIEIAARGGGVYLSSHLTPKASGVNTNEIILDYLLNDKVIDVENITLEKKVAAWRCFELFDGVIEGVSGVEDVENIIGVDKVCMDDIKIGQKVEALQDDTSKYGPILVSGNSRKECYDVLSQVETKIKVCVKTQDGRKNIRW